MRITESLLRKLIKEELGKVTVDGRQEPGGDYFKNLLNRSSKFRWTKTNNPQPGFEIYEHDTGYRGWATTRAPHKSPDDVIFKIAIKQDSFSDHKRVKNNNLSNIFVMLWIHFRDDADGAAGNTQNKIEKDFVNDASEYAGNQIAQVSIFLKNVDKYFMDLVKKQN